MLTKKVKVRISVLFFFILLAVTIALLVLKSLEDNVVYFFSPSEVNSNKNISFNKTIRIGGLVKKDSINKEKNSINFIITDLNNEIIVSYSGLIPNLFSEEKGVVAEGQLKDNKYFIAEKILAKHDENYMPPEVKMALEEAKN